MAFCPQCGTETQESFCPACGARADAPPAPPASVNPALQDHIVSALCYLAWPLTGVLFLVLEPYSKSREIRFHALQSILVFGALFGGFYALTILAYLPFIGLLFTFVTLAYPIFAFGLWVYLMFKTFTKERVVVPVLGAFASSQA